MTNRTKNLAITLSFILLTGILCILCLVQKPTAVSDAERRPLAQLPEFSGESLLNGRFFSGFDSYTVDQFPLRDSFRSLKAFVQTQILNRSDNNGYYMADGFIGKTDYPLNTDSITHATDRMQFLYDSYFKGGNHKVFYSVIPDKSYFLAEKGGYPAMDYAALLQTLAQQIGDDMTYVDIFPHLSIEDYYRTDTHWRQEQLLDVAQKLAQALGVADRLSQTYTQQVLTPFYGVYSGQSAFPCDPEPLYYLTNETLENCTVYNTETGATGKIYDLERFYSSDPYEVFLSGSQAILTIQNPVNTSGDRLIVFRDSFGSSLTPLLAEAYSEIVLVDIRYVSSALLGHFLELNGSEDVLFLYSTLVLNSSSAMK